jgi:hypothetical protein
MTGHYEAVRSRRADLRATWNRVSGAPIIEDPVLRNAIKDPRIAKRYGSDPGDYGFSEIGARGVDTFIKRNHVGDRRTIRAVTS